MTLLLLVLGFGLAGLCLYSFKRKSSLPLPPGPKPKPILGNLSDLPPPGEQEWVHWAKHKELYGPISSVTTFGQTLVIINDQDIAFELLDKQSSIYSSRPRMVFGGEMVGWQYGLVALPYSDRFRAYRRNIHGLIGSKAAVSRYNPLQEIEVRRFLLRVMKEPKEVLQYARTLAGAVILKISHGYTIEPHGRDPLVDLADQVLDHFSRSAVAGVWAVDTIPFLKYLPAWLPGMGSKRTAQNWRRCLIDFTEKPHAFVKQQMAAGTHSQSYTSSLLEKGDLNPEEESIVKWSAQSLYAGGADTAVSVLQCFFLAMMVYPDVQSKAQREIDTVIGNDRLPGFEDRESLPYIDAIVKEILRWHPVGPLAFPHMSTSDETYNGYFIPKGALLIPNIWWFTHDPKAYHDPMNFKPERFLDGGDKRVEMDPHHLSFGFGRRICPGRELADAMIYLTIAHSLAVFNINKPVENGQTVEPIVAFTPGALSHPVDFKVELRPRSGKAEALIKTIEVEHPFTTGDSKSLHDLQL